MMLSIRLNDKIEVLITNKVQIKVDDHFWKYLSYLPKNIRDFIDDQLIEQEKIERRKKNER